MARNHLLAHVVKWYGKIASTPFPRTIDHFSREILTRAPLGHLCKVGHFKGLSWSLSWQLLRPRSAVEGPLQGHGSDRIFVFRDWPVPPLAPTPTKRIQQAMYACYETVVIEYRVIALGPGAEFELDQEAAHTVFHLKL